MHYKVKEFKSILILMTVMVASIAVSTIVATIAIISKLPPVVRDREWWINEIWTMVALIVVAAFFCWIADEHSPKIEK